MIWYQIPPKIKNIIFKTFSRLTKLKIQKKIIQCIFTSFSKIFAFLAKNKKKNLLQLAAQAECELAAKFEYYDHSSGTKTRKHSNSRNMLKQPIRKN